jgi:putative sugar O-methyltransferase
MINKKNFFIFILICFSQNIFSRSFESIWFDMRIKYEQLVDKFENVDTSKFHASYYENLKNHVANLIRGNPNINFLRDFEIAKTMLRQEFTRESSFEECFLKNCLNKKNQEKIQNFKDDDRGLLPKPSSFGSVSTVGHLFYAAKIMENLNHEPKIIIEFGGGYGNLSRIMKKLNPEAAIVIFDIPEIMAIQYLFLSYVIPETQITMHQSAINNSSIKHGINLVPVYFINESDIKADVFISTFALSETPEYVQNLVINKKFFDADLAYISGQINGWREIGINLIPNQNIINDALRQNYKHVNCKPFHIYNNTFSYESIAKN